MMASSGPQISARRDCLHSLSPMFRTSFPTSANVPLRKAAKPALETFHGSHRARACGEKDCHERHSLLSSLPNPPVLSFPARLLNRLACAVDQIILLATLVANLSTVPALCQAMRPSLACAVLAFSYPLLC